MQLINGTKILSPEELDKAAKLLKQGKLIAFPTETVYGLGANALDPEAVNNIFAAKGRPADNPLIVHIAEAEDLNQLISGRLPEAVTKLIADFWPGPLTVVLPKNSQVPAVTTGGLETVAVRMPEDELARELIRRAEVPLAAPSANLSGRPSPTLAQHVIDDLAGRISGVVDGGQTGIGVESTVLDCSQEVPTILRPGDITYEQLQKVLDQVAVDSSLKDRKEIKQALSPGMKYQHYSPQAEVVLAEGTADQIAGKIKKLVNEASESIGIMATTENQAEYPSELVKNMGSRDNLRQISNNIFKLLREFDQENIDKIVVESVPEVGLGAAIMNRLRKAANEII